MARIETGNNLGAALQQPGGKVSDDGYGLLTATVVYKVDESAISGNPILVRGSNCPIEANCKAHRFSYVIDALGIATLTVDYVGIADGATMTDPQITGSQGLTSEHITTHPNFFELATGFSGSPIAGVGTGTLAAPVYTQVPGPKDSYEYQGNNGATFEQASGKKFLGFKVAEYKDFYGKTSYLAPQCSISGVFYTSLSTKVVNLRNAVGKTSGTGTFASTDLLPSYMGTSFTTSGKNQLLLAQVSFEDYGLLYKVQYELRFNRDGYPSAVYASA